ncbi:hypothetical protein [Hymenobacter sp. PAMC 26628]|uniref:hypothetical protein n=1 Tax=Hymenobacter sp. PAMC 26628 TaxID=1484118 RepID=UPI0007702178|nr:hypothetical protein [Hymenobacter sp. PAMC 26628]AMJ67521.1 hypothetical protein AXW84_20430 [Hymenobacter sp. PAMC 26628]
MKRYLLLLVLLGTTLAGCHKADPTPDDPLLGHWQSDAITYQVYDPTGKLDPAAFAGGLSSVTNQVVHLLDVTSTTFTFNANTPGVTPTSETYTRTGEVLTFPNQATYQTFAARSLTATAFVYEVTNLRSDGSRFVATVPYHR